MSLPEKLVRVEVANFDEDDGASFGDLQEELVRRYNAYPKMLAALRHSYAALCPASKRGTPDEDSLSVFVRGIIEEAVRDDDVQEH